MIQAAPEYSASHHQEGPDPAALSNLRPPPGGSMLIREIREYLREQSSTQCGAVKVKETTKVRTEVIITAGSGGSPPSGGSRTPTARSHPKPAASPESDRLRNGELDRLGPLARSAERSPLEALLAVPLGIARPLGIRGPDSGRETEQERLRQQEVKTRSEKEKALRARVSQVVPDAREEELSAAVANVDVDNIRNQADVNAAAEEIRVGLDASRAERLALKQPEQQAEKTGISQALWERAAKPVREAVAQDLGVRIELSEAVAQTSVLAASDPLAEQEALAVPQPVLESIAVQEQPATVLEDTVEQRVSSDRLMTEVGHTGSLAEPEGQEGFETLLSTPDLRAELAGVSDAEVLRILDQFLEEDEDLFDRERVEPARVVVPQPFDWSALAVPEIDRAELQHSVQAETAGAMVADRSASQTVEETEPLLDTVDYIEERFADENRAAQSLNDEPLRFESGAQVLRAEVKEALQADPVRKDVVREEAGVGYETDATAQSAQRRVSPVRRGRVLGNVAPVGEVDRGVSDTRVELSRSIRPSKFSTNVLKASFARAA